MPELPDVEGHRRFWRTHVTGRRVQRVRVHDDGVLRNTSSQGLGRSLSQRRFESPARWGKWLLAPTDGPAMLLLHFGMTGLLASADTHDEPGEYGQVVFELDRGWVAYRSQRKLGGLWLVRSESEREAVTGPLGPDAGEIDRSQLHKLLSGRRGGIKSTLMNQEVMAGVGNELSDEVLWRAGVHPRTRTDALDDDALDRLADALEDAIAGSVEAGHIPASEGWLNAVRGTGDPRCPRCGAEVASGTVAGRTAYWCVGEQPEPR